MPEPISDKELDRLVAEKIMGWRVHTKEYPPLSNSYVSYYVKDAGEFTFQVDEWQPTRDATHFCLVLRRIAKVRGYIALTIFADNPRKDMWSVTVDDCIEGSDADLYRAACLAIIRFLEAEEEDARRRKAELDREERIRAEVGEDDA